MAISNPGLFNVGPYTEIFHQVFLHLNLKGILVCRSVCQQWCKTIDQDPFWEVLGNRDFPSQFQSSSSKSKILYQNLYRKLYKDPAKNIISPITGKEEDATEERTASQLKISQEVRYLFQNLVSVGGDFKIGDHAHIVIQSAEASSRRAHSQLTLGTWTQGQYTIKLYQSGGNLSAELTANQGPVIRFSSSQIKYGLNGNLSHESLIEKISKIGQEAIDAIPYPADQPTELRILEVLPLKPVQPILSSTPEKKTSQEQIERSIFESSLKTHLASISPQPTCFICFNVSEQDVGNFLRTQLVPDLEKAGFKTHFCFRDLNLGDNLYNFMNQAYHADKVVVICTPGLQKKIQERVIGVTYEIERLIIPRIEARGIDNTGVFPVYYSGSRQEACPSPGLIALFSTKLLVDSDDQWKTYYFANAFRLFAAMKGMSREKAHEIVSGWKEEIKNPIWKEAIKSQTLVANRKVSQEIIEIDPDKISKIIEYHESQPCGRVEHSLDLLTTGSKNFQRSLKNAEEASKRARQAIEAYMKDPSNFEDIKEKIDEAVQYYAEIDTDERAVQSKIKLQKDLLIWEWKNILFSHARSYCLQPKLFNHRDIEEIEEILKDADPRQEAPEFLKDSLESFLKKCTTSLKNANLLQENGSLSIAEGIEIKDMIETRLFGFAIAHALLDHREKAIEGFFRLSDYHSIATKSDQKVEQRSLLIQSSLLKARSLETREEKIAKGHLIHQSFVEILKEIRTQFSYNPFRCFISYDAASQTEDWVKNFLYRDFITLGIRPIFRALSQPSGTHEVDYGKQIREAEVTVVLCTPDMKLKYEDYLRGIRSNAKVGIEMEFLKDRYLSGKELHHTFHIQMKGEWSEIAFTNLPEFFQRKNLVNFCEKNPDPYSDHLTYFKTGIAFFCDLLEIPENEKENLLNTFRRKVEKIENQPFPKDLKTKVEEFIEEQKISPPLPLLPDPTKNTTRLIGVPSIGKEFQPRKALPLEALFKETSRIVLTQDSSILCGVGKTYLACQYAYEYGSKYSHVLWIEGKNEETLQDSFLKIEQRLGKEHPEIKDKASLLQWIEKTPGLLLIFDGVPSSNLIAASLPSQSCTAHILISSRDTNWKEGWEVKRLGLLTLEEGKSLLTKITRKHEDKASEELVELLGYIPSLIAQAGYFLKQTNDAPSFYPTILESENAVRRRLAAQRGNVPIPKHFVGRKQLLAALQEIVMANPSATLILQGPPCIGKTSIAHQFAFENVAQFKLLWNFSCGDQERFKRSAIELATRLGVPQEEELSKLLQGIYKRLSQQGEKTLLIFDDLSKEQIGLLPSGVITNLYTLVVTTQEIGQKQEDIIIVPSLTKQEALVFLKSFLEGEKAEFLSKNIDLFMGNLFALSLAAHCLKTSKEDLKKWTERFKAEIGENRTVDTLFSAIWKEVQHALSQMPKLTGSEKIVPLIKICACSSRNLVAKSKLEAWLAEELKDQNLDPEVDPIPVVLRDLLTRLSQLGVIEQTESSIAVHPLLKAAIKKEMKDEEQALYASKL